jgi:hypothetical protein
MSSPRTELKTRVERLEADLKATPMRHYIYSDLPFAIFCYRPDQEWHMRHEMRLLRTRLENALDREVATISLGELLWQAVEECEGIEEVAALERRDGFDAAQMQLHDYLSDPDWRPLYGLLAERLDALDPDRHIAFITRAGALAPNIYRVSKLLDEMKGRTRVPCVLFMPATTEGSSLRFMGIAENEGRGSYHTNVYA